MKTLAQSFETPPRQGIEISQNTLHTTLIFTAENFPSAHKILRKFFNQEGFHDAFRAMKKLGKGNFAHVYLVEKKSTFEKFAVKAFSKECAYSSKGGKAAVDKEISIIRRLNHPNLLKLFEVYETVNSLYLILEYIDGGCFSALLKKSGKLSEEKAIFYMQHLMKGVAYLHSLGIMHRDIKPDNLMFRKGKNEELVLVDFGLATEASLPSYIYTRCGTPGYVAPEVANQKNPLATYSVVCDIFSCGIILHMMFGIPF